MKHWLFIHCAATPPRFEGDSRDIRDWHVRQWPNFGRNGWAGYNEVITRSGEYQNAETGHPCTPLGRRGAHTGECSVDGTDFTDLNLRGIGVCLIGGVDDQGRPANNFTPAQWKTLAERVAHYRERFTPLQASGRIMGHRDAIKRAQAMGATRARAKACPSFSVETWLHGVSLADRERGELRGMFLDLLGAASSLAPLTHTVMPGDTLGAISDLYGVTLAQLVARNGIDDPNRIEPGQQINIFEGAS